MRKIQVEPIKEKEQCEKIRFMPTSKMIGLVAFIFIAIIVAFSMFEMHRSMDYSSMSQLIISAFAFAGVYAGFYLTMAKVEHAEEVKAKREIELAEIKKECGMDAVTPEDVQSMQQEISDMNSTINNLINREDKGIF